MKLIFADGELDYNALPFTTELLEGAYRWSVQSTSPDLYFEESIKALFYLYKVLSGGEPFVISTNDKIDIIHLASDFGLEDNAEIETLQQQVLYEADTNLLLQLPFDPSFTLLHGYADVLAYLHENSDEWKAYLDRYLPDIVWSQVSTSKEPENEYFPYQHVLNAYYSLR